MTVTPFESPKKTLSDMAADMAAMAPRKQNGSPDTVTLRSLVAPMRAAIPNIVRLNLFTGALEVVAHPPWDDDWIGAYSITDKVIDRVDCWLQEIGYEKSTPDIVRRALGLLGELFAYDPLRSYIEKVSDDGGNRILDGFCQKYLRMEFQDNRFAELNDRGIEGFLCNLVDRALNPGRGAKAKIVPVLCGRGNFNKSEFGYSLVPDPKWFSDTLPINLADKDAKSHLRGLMFCELSELAYLGRTSFEVFKTFIAADVMRLRLPYDRTESEWPVRCVFYATSNHFNVLKDPTGDVRNFPMRIDRAIDAVALKRDRDLIWGEARRRYYEHKKHGTQWWLTDDERKELAVFWGEFQDVSHYDARVDQWLDLEALVMDEAGNAINVRVRDCYFYREHLESFVLGLGATGSEKYKERTRITDALMRAGCSPKQVYLRDRKANSGDKSVIGRPTLWRQGEHPQRLFAMDEVFSRGA